MCPRQVVGEHRSQFYSQPARGRDSCCCRIQCRLSWPAVGPVCAFLYYFEACSASLTYAGGLKAQQCSECFESTQCMVVSILQGAHTLCAGFPNFACFQPEARELSSSVGSLLGVNSVGELPHFHESHLSNTAVSKLSTKFET